MKYVPSTLLALWRAARPSTDRSALPAFEAPAAFRDEIREDQLSRASSPESDIDDECEDTSFDLPEGWDNDATDAAFAKGAAILRGQVGIDELTEVKVLREPPLVRAERTHPATPVSTGLLGALGAATAVFQPRMAIAFSAVAIVAGAIVLTHHRPAADQHPDIAKAEPEQQQPAPEQAMPAPRSEGAQVAMAQPNLPPSPPAVQESASVQGPKAAAASTLQRVSIASPAPGPASGAVAVLPMQRQDAVARNGATSPTGVTVPRAQVPEAEPVIAMRDSAPVGALPVTPVPPAPEDVARARFAEIRVRDLVADVMPRVSGPASQTVPAVEPLQEAACATSNTACLTDAWARSTKASERLKQTIAALAADLAAANAALEACDASDTTCLDAALPKAVKAREQFEQKLTLARTELAVARAALERSNARVLASDRDRLAIEQRRVLAAAMEGGVLERSNGRALVSDRAVLKTQTNAATASQERRIVEGAAEVAGSTALVREPDVRSGCSASPALMGAVSCERKAATKVGMGPR